MKKNNSAKVGLAIAAGTALGYVASLFISNKTKKTHKKQINDSFKNLADKFLSDEDQKKVVSLYKKNSKASQKSLQEIRESLAENLEASQTTLKQVNKKKYLSIVKKTIDDLQKKGTVSASQVNKLKKYLEEDYQLFKEAKEETAEKE